MIPGGVPEWASELVMPLALGAHDAGLRVAARRTLAWSARGAVAPVAAAFALGLAPETSAAWAGRSRPLILLASLAGAPIFVVMGALALLLFFKDGTPVAAVSAEVSRLDGLAAPAGDPAADGLRLRPGRGRRLRSACCASSAPSSAGCPAGWP